MKGSKDILKEYPESKANLDPFKLHVVNGLGKYLYKIKILIALSLSELGADTMGNANSIKFQASAQASIHKSTYPYTPDLLFRYQNKSIVSNQIRQINFVYRLYGL